MVECQAESNITGGSVEVWGRASRTIACRRRQPASAPLSLSAAPDAERSAPKARRKNPEETFHHKGHSSHRHNTRKTERR
jgi:hypothetical protein